MALFGSQRQGQFGSQRQAIRLAAAGRILLAICAKEFFAGLRIKPGCGRLWVLTFESAGSRGPADSAGGSGLSVADGGSSRGRIERMPRFTLRLSGRGIRLFWLGQRCRLKVAPGGPAPDSGVTSILVLSQPLRVDPLTVPNAPGPARPVHTMWIPRPSRRTT